MWRRVQEWKSPMIKGWTVSPKKTHQSPLPSISECDLIWKWSVYRGNQVQMELVGSTLSQYDWCPQKRVNVDTETDIQRENDVKKPREKTAIWLECYIYKPRNTPNWGHTPETRRGKGGFSPYGCQREQGPIDNLTSDFWLQKWERTSICCFKWYILGTLLRRP